MVETVGTYRGCTLYKHPGRGGNKDKYSNSCTPYLRYDLARTKTDIDKMYAAQEPAPAPEPAPKPVAKTMNFVENYRGVNIYQYDGGSYSASVEGSGIASTDKNTVKYLIDQKLDTGSATTAIQKPPEDVALDVRVAADERTTDSTQVEVKPSVVDTYNGVPVTYQPNSGLYYVKVDGKEKYATSIDGAHAFIDHEQYVNSPLYQAEQDKKRIEREEALERARIYGIGVDDQGNEIPPSDEEIEKRETFYASEYLSRGTTIREEYEEERGVTPSPEELALREEAREKEAEATGQWFKLYWLKLLAEWRNFMGMIT